LRAFLCQSCRLLHLMALRRLNSCLQQPWRDMKAHPLSFAAEARTSLTEYRITAILEVCRSNRPSEPGKALRHTADKWHSSEPKSYSADTCDCNTLLRGASSLLEGRQS
jgi:hypothetical protein